jgi:anthranilate synthase/aminodeoxychorismate synthase-like glutamine amidotransferase
LKIALIDHNDSFTYNIIELLQDFKNVFVDVIPYTQNDLKSIENYDKIILSPGPGLPKDYPKTQELIKNFYTQKPIFGICLGHQLIGEFFGLEVYNLNEVKHGVLEQIVVDNSSVLYNGIDQKINVGLYHSWAVKQQNVVTDLLVTALNMDKIIMSVQHKKYPIYGVQYHVESFLTNKGSVIMKNFILNG